MMPNLTQSRQDAETQRIAGVKTSLRLCVIERRTMKENELSNWIHRVANGQPEEGLINTEAPGRQAAKQERTRFGP